MTLLPVVAGTVSSKWSKGSGGPAGDEVQNMICVEVNGIINNLDVRRLTPTECERLQGFSDGWTQVPYRNKPAADGPRYTALGNAMAVPVMRWLGKRIGAQ